MTADIGILVFIVLLVIAGVYAVRFVLRYRQSLEAKEQNEMPQRLQDDLAKTDEYIRSLDAITTARELEEKNRNRRKDI